MAGISISSIVGDNGIIEKAKKARTETEKAEAKEKLEIELINLGTDKDIDSNYNKDDYITNRLLEKGMDVADDLVLVDDWLFEIDRNVPEIKNIIGKAKRNNDITIYPEEVPSEGFIFSTIRARITFPAGNIASVEIGRENVNYVDEGGQFIAQKDVNENGKYSILVKDTDGNFQFTTIDITKIIDDLLIYNKADLESFRNKVNEGATFEGKKVKLMADINLENKAWTPINSFKGTFFGNEFKIENLKITSAGEKQGLFGTVEKQATIKDLTISSGSINNASLNKVGAIAGCNKGNIDNCKNNIAITGGTRVGGIVGENQGIVTQCENSGAITGKDYVGGVIGDSVENTTIKECINTGTITLSNNSTNNSEYNFKNKDTFTCIGGVIGNLSINSKIEKCKNEGNVTGKSNTGGVVGKNKGKIEYCWNKGNIIGKGHGTGGIVGGNLIENNAKGVIQYCTNFGVISGHCMTGGIIGYGEHVYANLCSNRGQVKSQSYSTSGCAGR